MKEFFTFSSEEAAYLNQVNEGYDSNLSPFAAWNKDAIRRKPMVRHDIIRPPYSYDVDCILHSTLYNRYGDKTQVFSFYENDDITRRALHVQFVSKIARTIGRALKLNLELIEAIALGHDMGHTPFGHKGEEFLSACYQEATGKSFHHNVHSVRIFRYILNSNLTLQTLSGILSHNGEKVSKNYMPAQLDSFETFDQLLEQCYTEPGLLKTMHPNTLEGCVVRISDMIAYAGKDRQDLYKAQLITKEKFEEQRMIGTTNRDIISNMVINVIKNSIEKPALTMDEAVFQDLTALIGENYKVIYNHEALTQPYFEIIQPLMEGLYAKLTEDVRNKAYTSPVFKHYLDDGIQGNFYRHREKCYVTANANDIVTDFIASMTDDYFIAICRYLHINDTLLKKLKYHGYFDEMTKHSGEEG